MKRTSSSTDDSAAKRLKATYSSSTEQQQRLNHLPKETLQHIMDYIPFQEPILYFGQIIKSNQAQHQPAYNHVNFALTCRDVHSAFTQHPYSYPSQLRNMIQQQIPSYFVSSCGKAKYHNVVLSYMQTLKECIQNQVERIEGDNVLQNTKIPEWIRWRDGHAPDPSYCLPKLPLTHIPLDQRRVLYDKMLSRVTFQSISHTTVSHYDDYDSRIQINGECGVLHSQHHAHDDDCETHFTISIGNNDLISSEGGDVSRWRDALDQVRTCTGITVEELSHKDLIILVVFATPYLYGSNQIYIHEPETFFDYLSV